MGEGEGARIESWRDRGRVGDASEVLAGCGERERETEGIGKREREREEAESLRLTEVHTCSK